MWKMLTYNSRNTLYKIVIRIGNQHPKYNLWFHIDASYGGFAILSNHSISKHIKKIGLADSIVVHTHKWLFTPMEGGLTVLKKR